MGFRFRKRIKLFPVLWLNASKSGIPASIGGHGATLTVNRKGVQGTAGPGLPGSGVSYRTKPPKDRHKHKTAKPLQSTPGVGSPINGCGKSARIKP